ncbi:MAG: hypothetical protein KDA89_05160 [Planctomycetaceae bacterium]|nr:hypothetical protein [Planctomycetaceae bacterium]
MSMNIELRLPTDVEQALQRRAAESGDNIENIVTEIVVETLRADVVTECQQPSQGTAFGDWLKTWGNRHPRLDREADVSRESIYSGRGE